MNGIAHTNAIARMDKFGALGGVHLQCREYKVEVVSNLRVYQYVAILVVLELRIMMLYSMGVEEVVSWYGRNTHAAIRCLHPLVTGAESLHPCEIHAASSFLHLHWQVFVNNNIDIHIL